MGRETFTEQHPTIQKALSELKDLILQRYPDASFTVFRGDDPDGIYLRALVDVQDTDEVVDVFIDCLLTLQVEEQLPLYVVPIRPLAKVLEATKAQRINLERHMGSQPPLTV